MHSIGMLRRWNLSIPIHLLYFGKTYLHASVPIRPLYFGKTLLLQYAEKYNFQIDYIEDSVDTIFHFNKVYLKNYSGKILFIDADTFIFGDVEKLFDYQEDFVACENKWMENWNYDWFGGIRPFNGGVLLFNNNSQEILSQNLLKTIQELKLKQTDWAKWITTPHILDEMAYTQLVFDLKLSYNYFKKEHCSNILHLQDLKTMQNSIIFHCYSKQWQMVYDYLENKKITRRIV